MTRHPVRRSSIIDLRKVLGICHDHGQRSMDSKFRQHRHPAVGDQHFGRLLVKESKCLCTFHGRSDFKASPCRVEPDDIQESFVRYYHLHESQPAVKEMFRPAAKIAVMSPALWPEDKRHLSPDIAQWPSE